MVVPSTFRPPSAIKRAQEELQLTKMAQEAQAAADQALALEALSVQDAGNDAPKEAKSQLEIMKERLERFKQESKDDAMKAVHVMQKSKDMVDGLKDTLVSVHKTMETTGLCLASYFRQIPFRKLDKEIADRFNYFDRDGSGKLDKEELREALAEMGQRPSDSELDEFFIQCDTDSDGSIDLAEFGAMVRVKLGLGDAANMGNEVLKQKKSLSFADKRERRHSTASMSPIARRGSLPGNYLSESLSPIRGSVSHLRRGSLPGSLPNSNHSAELLSPILRGRPESLDGGGLGSPVKSDLKKLPFDRARHRQSLTGIPSKSTPNVLNLQATQRKSPELGPLQTKISRGKSVSDAHSTSCTLPSLKTKESNIRQIITRRHSVEIQRRQSSEAPSKPLKNAQSQSPIRRNSCVEPIHCITGPSPIGRKSSAESSLDFARSTVFTANFDRAPSPETRYSRISKSSSGRTATEAENSRPGGRLMAV